MHREENGTARPGHGAHAVHVPELQVVAPAMSESAEMPESR